jgi:hypothetical protein
MRCANIFIKSLIVSLLLFFFHSAFFVATTIVGSSQAYFGLMSGLAYFFIFGFWIYYTLTLLYLLLTKHAATKGPKIITAMVISLIGYLLARTSDIVDGEFFLQFDFFLFLVFMFSAFLLVVLDSQVSRKSVHEKK